MTQTFHIHFCITSTFYSYFNYTSNYNNFIFIGDYSICLCLTHLIMGSFDQVGGGGGSCVIWHNPALFTFFKNGLLTASHPVGRLLVKHCQTASSLRFCVRPLLDFFPPFLNHTFRYSSSDSFLGLFLSPTLHTMVRCFWLMTHYYFRTLKRCYR